MSDQKINCPDCNTPIPYDTYGLIQGKKFSCPQCGLTLALAAQSRDTVQDTMEEFEQLKANILKQKDNSKLGFK